VTHLLDTNTCISQLRKGGSAGVAKKLAAAPPGTVLLCSVVVGELVYGAHRSADVSKNLAKVGHFCSKFQSLPYDDASALEYGRIRAHLAAAGTLIGPNDLLIASIALASGLTLVTHNTAEFGRVPNLKIEDWELP
jgi:tRNA(fMet)-specific endonuclease VapC